jgi:hypothetical protein
LFLINVVPGVAAIAALGLLPSEPAEASAWRNLDLAAFALMAGALACLESR